MELSPEIQPSMPKKTSATTRTVNYLIIGSVILLILLISTIGVCFKVRCPYPLTALSGTPTTILSIVPTPSIPAVVTPTKVFYRLPTGSQTYRFSHGPDVKGPKILSATINPLDPKSGSEQIIAMEINSVSELTKATVTFNTDHQSKEIGLKFVSGTLARGVYQGSWKVSDTFDNVYSVRYILSDSSGTYDNTMHIR